MKSWMKFNKSKLLQKKSNTYFAKAASWADDLFATMESSRNRWRAINLYILTPIIILLLIIISFLIPSQHLQPLLINHYSNGDFSVTPIRNDNIPQNAEMIQSDIVRYIVNRESYSAESYRERYTLVNLLSDGDVANQYMTEQNSNNKNSPINILGAKGIKNVHISSILFLDRESKNNPQKKNNTHHNLAEVHFSVTTTDLAGNSQTQPFIALVAWNYRGITQNQNNWLNWNGFTVTHYEVEQQNIS